MSEVIKKFIADGWVIVNLPDPTPVHNAVEDLAAEAYNITGAVVPLGEIHRYINDFEHFHLKLASYFWEKEHGLKIASACLPIIKDFIGLDIMAQYKPYLRVARPGYRVDNIGYHKDTQYGQTPLEIAIHIPFVDLDENSAINVISGTHLLSEKEFAPKMSIRTDRDSVKHTLGYPYSPKCLDVLPGLNLTPLVMTVGQVAIFTPALFHGQEVNCGLNTRISADIRMINTYACPIEKIGEEQNQYMSISNSPAEILAKKYLEAQNAS